MTLGGGDPHHTTAVVVEALRRLDRSDLEVRVVIGPANPRKELVRGQLAAIGGAFELVEQPGDIAALMAWADLTVAGAGSTCWELAFMGVPAVVIALAENQVPIATTLARAGIADNAGWHGDVTPAHLAGAIADLGGAADRRRRMSAAGRMLVDGLGAERVAALLRAEVA